MRKATIDDLKFLKEFVSRDYARNYFIALGLEKGFDTYKEIYIGDDAILFHRASGNLQYVSYNGDSKPFVELVKNLEFNYLIGPKSMCEELALEVDHLGGYISELKKKDFVYQISDARIMTVSDLKQVEDLYAKVFTGYPKADYMAEKLNSDRGIGYIVEQDELLSVAQSDFYRLIVGVATSPNHLKKGYALKSMMALMNKMFEKESSVYLQYDSDIAGNLYKKLGFKVIDRVVYYRR